MSEKWHSLVYWRFVWRRLHCLGDMRSDLVHGPHGALADAFFIDAGYCLDRYTLEKAPE